MAKARSLDKRRKSIRNIRKITRTMELIATARYKKAMDRATAATAYTKRITQVVADLANAGLEVSHPLLEAHDTNERAILLVLTAEAEEAVGPEALRRWVRTAGPRGRPLDLLLARDFAGFEDAVGELASRGFVVRAIRR